ncbi:MAG: DUF6249 domain-containing protein [Bacteroidales bacterium]|nr:DUF6249 domain-containing protein [Bacteroidales bacterium]
MLIPIFGIIGIFIAPVAMVVLVVWLITRQKIQRNKFKAELMAKAIEHGQTLPENFFDEPKKLTQRDKYLPAGMINIAVGLGLSLVLWSIIPDVQNIWTVGLIPLFVGLALLIIHFIEKKKESKENAK